MPSSGLLGSPAGTNANPTLTVPGTAPVESQGRTRCPQYAPATTEHGRSSSDPTWIGTLVAACACTAGATDSGGAARRARPGAEDRGDDGRAEQGALAHPATVTGTGATGPSFGSA